MKPKEIISSIKQASPFDIFLWIFLLTPIGLGGYVLILDRLNLTNEIEMIALSVIALFFIIFSAIAFSQTWISWSRLKKLTRARNIIARYMDERGRETISVRAVNANCAGVTADSALFYDLLSEYPGDFALAWSKSKILLLSRVVTAREVQDPPEG